MVPSTGSRANEEGARTMRKLIYGVLALALVATGCAITDYPVISDDRADYSGVIRTGHKAYIMGTSSVATIWDDGSDELFTMVYQNEYGDQKLYTFNNFDPTAAILFVDQTYCDWRYQGCELARATNPQNPAIDDPFDYEASRIAQGSAVCLCSPARPPGWVSAATSSSWATNRI